MVNFLKLREAFNIFKPVCPHIVHQARLYLETYKFLSIYLLKMVSQVRTCLSFLIFLKFKDNLSASLKKLFLMGKKMTENIIDRSETEPATVDNSLNIHRTALNKTTLVSEIPNIINEEMFIITLGQGKKPVPILSEKFCGE